MTCNSLNVIALISGGKDSMFSLLHCLANGHKVVALANLYPAKVAQIDARKDTNQETPAGEDHVSTGGDWDEDTNSYMYQTAGHNLIPLYAKALDLPLYRQEITGEAHDTSKVYEGRNIDVSIENNIDEIGSLQMLLSKAKSEHPEANAVSSGAILSTYQRTRVETIAVRLGLTPLSYLWQYPTLPPPSPGSLLHHMKEVGLDVRIIKVASGGLDEDLLWTKLLETKTLRKVERAMSRFGGSILGEGGEYETMVLSGPSELWKGKLEIAEADMKVISEGTLDAVAWNTFRKGAGVVVPHQSMDDEQRYSLNSLKKPTIWDANFEVLMDIESSHKKYSLNTQKLSTGDHQISWRSPDYRGPLEGHSNAGLHSRNFKHHVANSLKDQGITCAIYNLTSQGTGSASEQMTDIKDHLLRILQDLGHTTTSIAFTTVLLRSMSDFTEVNGVYGQLFDKPGPPARITVACPLPSSVRVMLSVVLGSSELNQTLHVQSRSYWAPANIGPYSQAVMVSLGEDVPGSIVLVAGQIPLVPATMQPLGSVGTSSATPRIEDFQERTCLSLQHLWRIGREMKVDWWAGAITFITGEDNVDEKARMIWSFWQNIHNPSSWESLDGNNESLDIWDLTYGAHRKIAKDVDEESLPNFPKIRYRRKSASVAYPIPGFLVVHVEALPRECDVEWQGLGFACELADVNEESIGEVLITEFSMASAGKHVFFVEVPFVPSSDRTLKDRLKEVMTTAQEKVLNSFSNYCIVYSPDVSTLSDMLVQIVPCHNVWGRYARKLAAAAVMILESRDI